MESTKHPQGDERNEMAVIMKNVNTSLVGKERNVILALASSSIWGEYWQTHCADLVEKSVFRISRQFKGKTKTDVEDLKAVRILVSKRAAELTWLDKELGSYIAAEEEKDAQDAASQAPENPIAKLEREGLAMLEKSKLSAGRVDFIARKIANMTVCCVEDFGLIEPSAIDRAFKHALRKRWIEPHHVHNEKAFFVSTDTVGSNARREKTPEQLRAHRERMLKTAIPIFRKQYESEKFN